MKLSIFSFCLFLPLFNLYSQTRCLVADYPLNNSAADVHGALDGTLYGTSPAPDRFGNPNKALYFNGISDWVRLGTDADFRERSVSLWFKADTFVGNGDFGLVFSTDNASLLYGGTGLAVDNALGANRLSGGVGANVFRFEPAVSNVWYHYVITVDENFIKLYLNNVLIHTTDNNSFSHSKDGDIYAHLGCSRKNDRFFKGSIDDVKIYNCAITSCEVNNLYHEGVSPAFTNDFKVYPNPANQKINITVPCDATGTFTIYNDIGQKIIETPIQTQDNLINIERLAAGIYTVVMNNKNELSSIKFLKAK